MNTKAKNKLLIAALQNLKEQKIEIKIFAKHPKSY
jgi:hypothetical protein